MLNRTGTDYLQNLQDGRKIIIDGDVIADVSEHPALKGGAATIAGLLDLQNNSEHPEMRMQEPGVDLHYAAAYAIPESGADVRRKGDAFRAVAQATGGLMARTPDFLAALLASWNASSSAFGAVNSVYGQNVSNYYDYSRTRNLVHSHAISDPPPDRFLELKKEQSLTLRKVGEVPEGIVVRGIKMLATLAPISDELLIYPFRPIDPSEPDQALAFAVSINTPGLKLFCRPGIAGGNNVFDGPLSERFDEMDSLCVFDDVIVPHDRVFIDGDVRFANALRAETGMVPYVSHQAASRVSVKAKFVLGLTNKLAQLSGRDNQPSVQQMLGEMAANAEVLRSLVVAAECEAHPDHLGNFIPAAAPLGASSVVASQFYARSIEILRFVGASGIVMHPSEADLQGHVSSNILNYFSAGSDNALTHVQLLKLASDLASSTFGGRQILYEYFYLGAPEAVKVRFLKGYSELASAEELAESLLVEPRIPSIQER